MEFNNFKFINRSHNSTLIKKLKILPQNLDESSIFLDEFCLKQIINIVLEESENPLTK